MTQLLSLLLLLLLWIPAHAQSWVLRDDGIGRLTVGMSVATIEKTLGKPLAGPSDHENQQCFHARISGHPDVMLMIEGQTLTRIDIVHGNTATSGGVLVGDSVEKAKKVYGQHLVATTHAYDERELYLTNLSRDGKSAIRFETHQGKISAIYGGFYKSVQYIEGCL